ncbi:MAG: hypothetical protein LBL15_00135, partial [Oscillospiraceae bacterium]|nr:hypothetical protein [Oscillospiraceae bacterium]
MNIIRRARGAELPKRMQKIFFSCDAGNADGRSALISDLLSMDAGMDCVVSYLAIPGEDIDENALKDELQENQALVLWVTDELLSAVAGSAFPIEYRIAEELHIPILPIANDGSLFPRFTEIAGAIHGIAMNDAEYRTQLKAQLESFLASEEVIRQIQERAFTAEVFLSYRKKDIKDARRFMKAFHDLEKFDAISIWYDGFLTAGRNFDYEIRDSITNCGAFVLLVTPNLATEGNYVQTAEYPFARQMNKPVVPAATIPTDQARFAALFPGAGLAVSVDNSAALRTVFLEKLDESAYKWQMDSERAYLLGIAYVKGLGVERDFDRGMRLLKKAADGSDLSALRAAQQLAGLYQN